MKKFLVMGFLCLAFAANADDFRDITKSCKELTLEKASITAQCTAENGAIYISALRLRGVNVVDGVLTLDENTATMSKFHTKCKETAIDSKGILAGKCLNDQKQYVWSFLDLKPLIRNYNGTLVYPLD